MPEIACVLCPANPKQPVLRCLKPLGGWCFTRELNYKQNVGLGFTNTLLWINQASCDEGDGCCTGVASVSCKCFLHVRLLQSEHSLIFLVITYLTLKHLPLKWQSQTHPCWMCTVLQGSSSCAWPKNCSLAMKGEMLGESCVKWDWTIEDSLENETNVSYVGKILISDCLLWGEIKST